MTPARVRPLFLSRARGRIAGALILALAFVLPPSAVARDWIVSIEGQFLAAAFAAVDVALAPHG